MATFRPMHVRRVMLFAESHPALRGQYVAVMEFRDGASEAYAFRESDWMAAVYRADCLARVVDLARGDK